jgi:hypothetical protein
VISQKFHEALSRPTAVLSVVGSHASEDIEDVLQRKLRNIEIASFTFWAFRSRGVTPTLVQCLAKKNWAPVLLIAPATLGGAEPTASTERAHEYSPDGGHWQPLPPQIGHVTGSLRSRGTALVLDQLEIAPANSVLDLWAYAAFGEKKRPVRIARGASTVCVRRASTTHDPQVMRS